MKKKNTYISAIILSISFGFLLFNEVGALKIMSLYNKNKDLEDEVNQLRIEENEIMNEIYLLNNDKEYIKKVAREKFYMAAPGEKIYRVEQEKNIK